MEKDGMNTTSVCVWGLTEGSPNDEFLEGGHGDEVRDECEIVAAANETQLLQML